MKETVKKNLWEVEGWCNRDQGSSSELYFPSNTEHTKCQSGPHMKTMIKIFKNQTVYVLYINLTQKEKDSKFLGNKMHAKVFMWQSTDVLAICSEVGYNKI